jgi:hypothetical protein
MSWCNVRVKNSPPCSKSSAGIPSLPGASWDVCILIACFISISVGIRSVFVHPFVRHLVNYDECCPPLMGEIVENVPAIYF